MAEFKLGRLRFVWKGSWVTGTTYVKDDIVKYGGTTYVCVVGHPANANFNVDLVSSKWEKQTGGQEWKTAPWTISTIYKEGDLVKYGGRVYICTENHTANATNDGGFYLDETANRWDLFSDGSEWVGNWQINEYYRIGDIVKYNGISYICVSPHTSAATITLGLEADYADDSTTKWEKYVEGFKYKGEWNGSADPLVRTATRYSINDIVKFGASLYLCIEAHTSNSSAFEELKWDLFVAGLEYEDSWSALTEYQIGDIVSYGGYAYVAVRRNTAKIPPTDTADWDLLTTGFNNRARYSSAQSYKVGDLVQYGGNVYVAGSEVAAGETPYTDVSKWNKIVDGFRWTNDWSNTYSEATYKIGDVVRYAASTYVCIEEHIPAPETTLAITNTEVTTNYITTSGLTTTLNVGQPIVFSGIAFGGISSSVTYYVKLVVNNTKFTVSLIKNGTTLSLSTASGSMTADYGNRPDLDNGDFWNSLAEGDANNVLVRRGDIVTRNAIQNVRLAKGAEGTVLKAGQRDLEWGKVGNLTRIYYVSIDGVDSPSRGTTWDDPWRTVKYACEYVQASGANTRSTPVVINVKAGVYLEQFPISIPKYVSLVGDELRMSIIEPTPATSGADKFYMRDSTTIRNFTFRGATGANLPDGTTATFTEPNQYLTRRPTGGAWCSLDPGTGPNDESVWVGERSPYIQNVTTFGDYAVGQKIDGALHNGGNKSITSNDFTQVMSDSIGAWCTNQGRAELVSVFTYYGYIGYLCENGGVIRATNGNCSYGSFGAVSEGVDPTEISRTATVDNRRLNAIVDRVQTDGEQVLYVEYSNAGEDYTTATYAFTGTGVGGSVAATPDIVNGGVCEVRIVDDGNDYLSVQGNAQAGSDIDLRLAAADTTLTDGYVGERVIIIDGQGVGQYGYVTSFDGGSKLITVSKETFTTLTITNTTSSTNLVTVADNSTLSADMPFTVTGTSFGGLSAGVQYYVKATSGGTQFTVYTDTATKTAITLTTGTGTLTLHKSGWDVFIKDITATVSSISKANPVVVTTTSAHELISGMQVVITGVTGMTEVNGNTYYITKTGDTTFALYTDFSRSASLNGTGFGTYVSGGTIVGEQAVWPLLNTTTRYIIEPRVVFSTGSGASATAVQTDGIDQINISTGGGGFTASPNIIISGDGTSSGGFGASATATIAGAVDDIIIANQGTGYTSAPTLRFVGGGLANNSVNHATATASITRTIKEVEVTDGGSGFTSPPSVVVSGTGGSGAIISAQISQVVGSLIVGGGGGGGYTEPPLVTISGGEPLVFAEAEAVLSATVVSITMQEGGSSYKPSTTNVTLISSSGFGGTAEAIIDNGLWVDGVTPGIITGINVILGGSGYSTPPTVVITGDGIDASATANISGSVQSISIINAGRGYQTVPNVAISGGGGAGATATATLTGAVFSLTVVDGGRGWVGTPSLAFSGGGGSSASASVTSMDSVIGSVTIDTGGVGYTSNPAIALSGGGGSGAILRSRIDGQIANISVTDSGGSFATSPLITFVGGNKYKSSFAGQRYYANASARIAIGSTQLIQTLAGIEQLRLTARAVIANSAPSTTYQSAVARVAGGGGYSAPTGIQAAVDAWVRAVYYTIENGELHADPAELLTLNREFIRKETMAFWDANYPATATATWSRDVGLLIDAIASDISSRGVEYSLNAAIKQVFLGTARTVGGNLLAVQDGIDYIKDLADNIIQNTIIAATPTTLLTAISATATQITTNWITVSDSTDLDEGQPILFIGTVFGGLTQNIRYYVKEIVNSTTITVSTTIDGDEVTLSNASGTLTLSQQVTDETLLLSDGADVAVENCLDYVRDIISTAANGVANAVTWVAASNLLTSNRDYIRAEVIAYINSTYTDFDYDQTLCARDVGYIVNAVSYDLLKASTNNPAVTSTTTGVISSISVDNGGQGYSYGVTISVAVGSSTVRATAVPVIDELTGAITSFTMTNKGKGYTGVPGITITPDTGSGAFARSLVIGSQVTGVTVIRPGSGYSAGPHMSLVDPNNTFNARFIVRVADGVLDQPKFTSRGEGYLTSDALVSGDGYADIAQVGGFVYIDNLTNVPTPGANIQFDNNDQFYKLVTVREVIGPVGVVGARQILLANKEFIQYEVISYLNNFVYDNVKCSRDVGYIIDAIADDFTYGSNVRTLQALSKYQRGTYASFETQRIQTAFAIDQLKNEINLLFGDSSTNVVSLSSKLDILIEWIKNSERYETIPTPVLPNGNFDVEDDRAKAVLLANEAFIVDQGVNYLLDNSLMVGFDEDIIGNEIRQIVRAVSWDLAFEGNGQSIEWASSIYIGSTLTIPGSTDSVADKADFLDLLNYLSSMMGDIARNQVVSVEPNVTETQNTSLPPGNTDSATRISTLVDDVMYDVVDLSPASAIPASVTPAGSSFTGFTTTARTTLLADKSTLQASVISWIDTNFVNFTYDQDVCFRDTGLIVQAVADDIYGDVAKSIEAGQRYYAATAALVLSEQKPQTIAAIRHINYMVQLLIRNETYTRTQTSALQVRFPSITTGDEAGPHLEDTLIIISRILEHGNTFTQAKQLLLDNKVFIQEEVVAYVSATYENLDYSIELCYRDVGLIIDSIAYDIFGGLSRSREAGLRYYQSASALRAITGDQEQPTIDALEYLGGIINAVLTDTDPEIRFQQGIERSRDSTLIFGVEDLNITGKVTECIDEILSIIDLGPSSLPAGRYSARFQISPPLSIENAPLHDSNVVVRSRYSQVRLTGHDFLNIGTGNKNDSNYPGIPLNAPNPLREVLEVGGGRVFYTSTDQDGNFRVGDLFRVEQSTGIATLNADAFNLSGLNELSLGGVSLGGSGAVINEFSTDSTFFANADNIVPTQKAIKTYIAAALGSGGGNIAVNAVTAGDIFLTSNEIDTIGGLQLRLLSTLGVLINSNEISSGTGTGALIVAGGVGIGGAVNIAGTTTIDGALTVTNTGFIKVASGTTGQRPTSVQAGQFRFNTSVSRFEGYNGTAWTDVSGVNPWSVKNNAYTAVAGDRLMINTSAGSVTVTLPASPVLGDTVRFIDAAGTFDFNAMSIDRNGQAIMGDNDDLTVNTRNAAFTLVYYNATYGWRLGEA
jgi:Ubiquitin-activating enzyme E1 FCCH domain